MYNIRKIPYLSYRLYSLHAEFEFFSIVLESVWNHPIKFIKFEPVVDFGVFLANCAEGAVGSNSSARLHR